MNRRNFINLLPAALAAASAPTLFFPKLIKPAWKKSLLPEEVSWRYEFTRVNENHTVHEVLRYDKVANIWRSVSKIVPGQYSEWDKKHNYVGHSTFHRQPGLAATLICKSYGIVLPCAPGPESKRLTYTCGGDETPFLQEVLDSQKIGERR